MLLTLQRNTGRLPGSFDEELIQRVMTEQLRQRTSKYTKELALKFRKADEKKSLSELDSIASVHSAPEEPSRDADPEPKAEEGPKEGLLSSNFGNIGQNPDLPENLKRLWYNTAVNGISANRSSDVKIDLFPFDDAPKAGSDNK